MTEYLYRAKLVPIGQPVNVPTQPDRKPWLYTFDRETFALEQASNRKINVCLDHDRLKVVGEVQALTVRADWWEATLKLDPGMGNEPNVGDPVSIGLQTLGIGSGTPFITEVSLVPRGAIGGAEIVSRYPIPSDRITAQHPLPLARQPAKPAAASAPTRVAAPTVIYRTPTPARAAAETAELNRRLDWIEAHTGRPADVEAVIVGMQREINGPSLGDLAREYGIGQVLVR